MLRERPASQITDLSATELYRVAKQKRVEEGKPTLLSIEELKGCGRLPQTRSWDLNHMRTIISAAKTPLNSHVIESGAYLRLPAPTIE